MKILASALILLSFCSGFAQNIPSKEIQIAGALSAAPEEDRSNAIVKGYDQSGNLITLKKGTNKLICLADNPKQEGFNSACYSFTSFINPTTIMN